MTQKFRRAVPVRNSPHFGTDFIYSEDQRTGKDRRAPNTALEIGRAMQREADAKLCDGYEVARGEVMDDQGETAAADLAAAIRSTAHAVDLEGLTERLAWTIHTATGLDLDPDDWIHLDPAIKEQRRTEARAVLSSLGLHAREN